VEDPRRSRFSLIRFLHKSKGALFPHGFDHAERTILPAELCGPVIQAQNVSRVTAAVPAGFPHVRGSTLCSSAEVVRQLQDEAVRQLLRHTGISYEASAAVPCEAFPSLAASPL